MAPESHLNVNVGPRALVEQLLPCKAMASRQLGSWTPLSLAAAVEAFSGAPFRWWISGGHALELHVGRPWRAHEDMDVGVVRRDVAALGTVLEGWDIQIAAAGVLRAWSGDALEAEFSQNNLWCRPRPEGPWLLDVTIGEGDDDGWIYRRDPRVRVPWSEAVLTTAAGVPYLAPDLQLLFKAKNPREKDDVDAEVVIPKLEASRRTWLRRMLPASHPWQCLLRDG